jgi:hypothetical protein
LPNEIFNSLGTVTEAKVQRLREIQAMTKCFAEVVKEDRAKYDAERFKHDAEMREMKNQIAEQNDEIRALKHENTDLQSRMCQLEALTVRDLQR